MMQYPWESDVLTEYSVRRIKIGILEESRLRQGREKQEDEETKGHIRELDEK